MMKQIPTIKATDEAVLPCSDGEVESYRKYIPIVRDRLCSKHKEVWDNLSIKIQCGFIAKMIETEAMRIREFADTDHEPDPRLPGRAENHFDQREHYWEMG